MGGEKKMPPKNGGLEYLSNLIKIFKMPSFQGNNN